MSFIQRMSGCLLPLMLFVPASAGNWPAGAAVSDESADQLRTTPPAVGDMADDFELRTLRNEPVKLSQLVEAGPVVVIFLRGFPGYQCPICNQQVGQFIAQAERFKGQQARVLLIYPGSRDGLERHAEQFLADTTLPDNFSFVTDPDYTVTQAWSLRWDAENETAYPATFVVDEERIVRFAKTSKSHGDRADADVVLKALGRKADR